MRCTFKYPLAEEFDHAGNHRLRAVRPWPCVHRPGGRGRVPPSTALDSCLGRGEANTGHGRLITAAVAFATASLFSSSERESLTHSIQLRP